MHPKIQNLRNQQNKADKKNTPIKCDGRRVVVFPFSRVIDGAGRTYMGDKKNSISQ